MYYIYFPFVIILAAFIYYECIMRQHPKWWAAAVLAAPVTAPYFIYKSRRENGYKLMMIISLIFIIVVVCEAILYNQYVSKNKYAHLPPLAQKMIILSEHVKETTIELDKSLVRLENLSKVEARIKEIKHTIEFIEDVRKKKTKNQKAIQELVKFTKDNKAMFNTKDLQWVFLVQQYYDNRNVVLHYKSLHKYLDDFEELLKYTYVNFYKIRDHQIEKVLKNYDEFYLRYRRSVDSHNRFNVKRIEFQNEFLTKYPQIKPYLPGERQTETFRLWE